MDDQVDQKYKEKHFPPRYRNINSSEASAAVLKPAHLPLQDQAQSISDIIASFSGLSIPPAPPPTEHSPAPPCPIASLPSEILVEILVYTAILDVASFARLAQVCKRFAYLVATEERVWKRVCLGSEFGFGGMHYQWNCGLLGE